MNLISNIKIQVKIRFKNHILSTFPLLNHCWVFLITSRDWCIISNSFAFPPNFSLHFLLPEAFSELIYFKPQ